MLKLACSVPLLVSLAAGCANNTTTNPIVANDMAVTVPSADLASPSTSTTTVSLKESDLVSDGADGGAGLVNAWGIAFNPKGFIWISDNHAGVTTVYDATGKLLLTVTVPTPPGGTPPSAPTGQVFNDGAGSGAFNGDLFILATEDGTISGWQTSAGANALLRVDNSASSTVYKGLAILSSAYGSRIYAADFHGAKVDTFDSSYKAVSLSSGAFSDGSVPAGFAPFGIQAVGTQLVVTYAKQDAAMHDDVKGPGNGYVALFDFDGKLVKHLVSQGPLNSPWATAMAPANFGAASGLLIIGNFGDGKVFGFDATSGALKATFNDAGGKPLAIDGLWALAFGPGTTGEATNQLFFTAGPGGEAHGLFGRLDLVP